MSADIGDEFVAAHQPTEGASYGARGSECTAALKGGRFCSSPAVEGLPFPLCAHHAIQIYRTMAELVETRRTNGE